jgi:hypothetical protein
MRNDQLITESANRNDLKLAGDVGRNVRDRLDVDSETVQIDLPGLLGELNAPGAPDMLGPAQSQFQRDVAEAFAGDQLFGKDFLYVVEGQRSDAAQNISDSLLWLRHAGKGNPRKCARQNECDVIA